MLRTRAIAALIAAGMAGGLAVVWLGMASGWFRGPYPLPMRDLAWRLGVPEAAYNFGIVDPGRVFRSAQPDERLLAWAAQEHAVRRLISLSGDTPAHATARAMGMDVSVFRWSVSELPPDAELAATLELLRGDQPVLIHCASGSDRTGYAVAAHRVRNEGWTVERAVQEMREYWHQPERYPALHAELAERLNRGS